MLPSVRTSSTLAALAVLAVLSAGREANAQASGCGDLQTHLSQRKSIADGLTVKGNKPLDAKIACAGFTQLVANGNTLLKWAGANKEWCQIPDGFIESIKVDHSKASEIRGKACGFAAKQAEMEKQAKNGGGQPGQPGQGGLLGGGGLSGATQLPQGAL